MSEVNYQALREAAQNYQSTLAWYQATPDSPNAERDCDAALAAFKREIRHREVDIIADLLDEREAQSKRIAELEGNRTTLAVENASMKLFIRGCCYVFDGQQDEISDAYICATDGGMPQIPATDAFLDEIRAQGVEMLAKNHQSIVNALKGDSLFSDGEYRHAAIVSAAVYFAAELRKGGNQ